MAAPASFDGRLIGYRRGDVSELRFRGDSAADRANLERKRNLVAGSTLRVGSGALARHRSGRPSGATGWCRPPGSGWPATVPSARATWRQRRFGSFGEGSCLTFPQGALFGERWIHIGRDTLVGPDVSLSAGMVPGQQMITDPVVRIGDRCMIGRGSHIVGSLLDRDRRRRLHRSLHLRHRPEPWL